MGGRREAAAVEDEEECFRLVYIKSAIDSDARAVGRTCGWEDGRTDERTGGRPGGRAANGGADITIHPPTNLIIKLAPSSDRLFTER